MSGGGGKSITYTYDADYNKGLLELSKEQQGWAKEMFNMFKYGVAYNPEETVRGAYIDGKWVDEKDLPRIKKTTREGYWDGDMPSYNDNNGNLRFAEQDSGSRWVAPVVEEVVDPSIKLETRKLGELHDYDPNAQTSEMEYMQNVVEANQQLLKPRTDLELAQIEAEKDLIPIQTEYQSTLLQDKTAGIQARAPLRTALYNEAMDAGNIGRRVSQAQADVQHAFDNTQGQFERKMFTSGISPNDSSYAMAINARNLNKAKAIAGARSLARDKAKDERFNRLRTALTMPI